MDILMKMCASVCLFGIDQALGGSVPIYNPKSEKVGTVWKTQIKKVSSDF